MSDTTAVEPTEEKDNLPAKTTDLEGLDTGLEDFETSDMVMPRLSIEHKDAKFKDNLTGESYDTLDVVVLGLIKQRILWHPDVEDNAKPLCKSFNFKEGHPGEKFPFEASGFDTDSVQDGVLPCESCALKDWGSHPRNDTPWCSEQHTFPILMKVGEEFAAPAILTVQRSAIKASKAYLTGFARSRTPVYTAITRLSLNAQKRGSVDYAVPQFARIGDTDNEAWGEYADHYRQIRAFITTPPPETDDDDPSPVDNSSQAAGDDDLPF